MTHPMKMAKYCYNEKDLDPKWNYLLPDERPILEKAIQKLHEEERELRVLLREAAEQSTENMGHDDATQESIRLTLWTLVSKIDYLRDALIHHTLLKVPKQGQKRVTFGTSVHLEGTRTLTVALLGGSDLPLERTMPDGILGVTYKSPLGKAILGTREGDSINTGKHQYVVRSIEIL